MLIVRSIIAGIGSVLIVAVLLPIGAYFYITMATSNEAIGFDPIAAVKSPLVWTILTAVFALGFYLRYRQLRSKSGKIQTETLPDPK